MAKKLYGTDPNQVPTNADLGTMAYQDSTNTVLENAYINAKGADGLEMGRDYTSPNNSSRLFFNSNVSGGNWTIFNNSGGLKIQSGAEAGSTSGNYTALALTTSNVTIGGNLVVGNGNGIDFSASQGSGASSSVLDDYEEGTWTPVVRVGSTSGTAVTLDINNAAFYTKIGDLVFINAQFRRGDATAHGGNLYITGLPYAGKSGTANPAGNMWLDNVSGDVRGISYISGANTYILGIKSGDTDAIINVNEFDNGRWIYVTATYQN